MDSFLPVWCVYVGWHLNFQWEKKYHSKCHRWIECDISTSHRNWCFRCCCCCYFNMIIDRCVYRGLIEHNKQQQPTANCGFFFCSLITWLSNNEGSINILLDDGGKFWQTVVTVNVFFLFVCLVIVCYCYWNIQKKKQGNASQTEE